MSLCDLGEESEMALCERIRTVDHDTAWQTLYDAGQIAFWYPVGSAKRIRIEQIVNAAAQAYEQRFGHEFIPF